MISKEEFFIKYRVTEEVFAKTQLEWAELEAIHNDFLSKSIDLIPTGNLITEHLRRIKEVHSLKMRIKDPEHLVQKIIRKKEKEPERDINLSNYQIEITDLIGVRALHLFKDDWLCIHEAITLGWDLHEDPIANLRKGDPEEVFKNKGCKVVEHEAGYRSVHYLVVSHPMKNQTVITEIQVRTIFEEGWSEIDHQTRYPYEMDNVVLSEYLAVFNRLAGMADEMGAFIKLLRTELKRRESEFANEIDERKRENEKNIQELESIKKKLESETDEKKKLQEVIDRLRSRPATGSDISDYGRPILGAMTARDAALYGRLGTDLYGRNTCRYCGRELENRPLIAGASRCPHCHIVQ